MTACAYRSLEPVLRERIAVLHERREQDAMFVDAAHRIAARRIGRAVGGGVGLAMGVTALGIALAGCLFHDHLGTSQDHGKATVLLFLAWPTAFVAGAIARLLARPLLSLGGGVVLSGNPSVDLARLEATDPLREACALASSWERKGAALPLAAASLLAPLTIHGVVWFFLARPETASSALDDFGTWITLSVIIVGHAHLALLVCSLRWASRLRSVETARLTEGFHRAWGTALLVSAGVACLPGIILLAIPPILVLVTGLVFVPLMFHVTARTIASERMVLAAA